MNARWLSAFPLLLVANPIAFFPVEYFGGVRQCAQTAERTATLPAGDAGQVRILAAAGELRVEGRPGISEVRVRGRACASHANLLDGIQIRTARQGSALLVEAQLPERPNGQNTSASLDLVVEVPAALALDVRDSSGNLEIRRVGGLRLGDSSGDIAAEEIAGDVHIEDSSGDLRLRGVRGDVWLSDSSGDIDVRDVEGSVLVEQDSSGDIQVGGVARNVRIRRDSSGGIDVWDVRGDLVVDRDSSGGVRHRNVAGQVRIRGEG